MTYTYTGPRLRFSSEAPGILRHLEPAVKRLMTKKRIAPPRPGGDDDIRKSDAVAMLVGR